MQTGLTILDPPAKAALTVPLIAAYLNRGFKQTEIASACGVTKQAVNQYISTHENELAPLINDDLLSMKFRHAVNQGIDLQNNILSIDQFDKKDLQTLATVTGINTDKSQVLQGKPSEISEDRLLIADINQLLEQLKP